MNLEEAIKYANNMTKTKYHHGMVQMGNLNDDEANFYFEEAKSYKQLAKWLEELKELRKYKEKYRRYYTEKWEEENLYQECRSCRHKYSTLECELCVDFDMYEEAL